MSDDVLIADAVAAALNGATLSHAFVAERSYVPFISTEELQELRAPHVAVIPATLEGTIQDRSGRWDPRYQIDVGIRKFVGNNDRLPTNAELNERCDAMRVLAEEVMDLFRGARPGDVAARCVEVRNDPIFDPKILADHWIFATVVSLFFRKVRP